MNYKFIVRWIIAAIISVGMVYVSEILGEKEIIFPEITALTVGGLMAYKQPWNTNKPIMWLTITISAIFGVFVVKYIDVGLLAQAMIGFAFVAVMLILSGGSFVPVLSACILPIYMHTESIIYPISVSVLTLLIVMAQCITEKLRFKEKRQFQRKRINKKTVIEWGVRFAVFFIIASIPIMVKHLYFVVPPLIVTFAEFSESESPVRQSPIGIWVIICISAVVGYGARCLNMYMDVSLTVCASAAFMVMSAVFIKSKKMFPPAGAISFLPLVFSPELLWLYPFEVIIGGAIIIAAAMTIGKYFAYKTPLKTFLEKKPTEI